MHIRPCSFLVPTLSIAMIPETTWAVTFIPMPKPKRVCRTVLNSKWAHYEFNTAFFGRGMDVNIPAEP